MYWFALGLAIAVISVVYWAGGAAPPAARRRGAAGALLGRRGGDLPAHGLRLLPRPLHHRPLIDDVTYLELNLIQGAAAVLLFIRRSSAIPTAASRRGSSATRC